MATKKRRDFVGIYKANKKGTGSAAQVKIANDKTCLFLEMAKQVRDMDDAAPYDWKDSGACLKLGESDLGKLLALFNGNLPLQADPKKADLELFHKNSKGNKVLKIKKQERGYYLKLSVAEGDKKLAIAIPFSPDDVELVRIALQRGYEILLGW